MDRQGTNNSPHRSKDLIASEETEKREFGSLDNIKDNYPKYVISMTPLVRRSDRQGVVHLGLREFLKNGFEKKLP